MSKNDFFYIGRGCSRDHLGPHKTQKWPEKRVEKEPKTGQDRPRYHKLPIHRPSGRLVTCISCDLMRVIILADGRVVVITIGRRGV